MLLKEPKVEKQKDSGHFDDGFLASALTLAIKSPFYLGNQKVVENLLKTLIKDVFKATNQIKDEVSFSKFVDSKCREVANILLGQDKKFISPKWFSPGNIDAYVGHQEGIDSEDPVERVAGALLNMLSDLFAISQSIDDGVNPKSEQWQFQVTGTIQGYTATLMGVPLGGYTEPKKEEEPTKEKKEKSLFSSPFVGRKIYESPKS